MTACDGNGTDLADQAPATETPSAPTSPDETVTPTDQSSESSGSEAPKPPRLIGYAGGESPGVLVHERADARDLHGAPASFKQFIADTAEEVVAGASCSGDSVGVTVQTLRTDGFAVGGVNECGGYLALWTIVDGEWKEVEGTQEAWDCSVLEDYHVPSEVVGTTCYDYVDQKQREYQQA